MKVSNIVMKLFLFWYPTFLIIAILIIIPIIFVYAGFRGLHESLIQYKDLKYSNYKKFRNKYYKESK